MGCGTRIRICDRDRVFGSGVIQRMRDGHSGQANRAAVRLGETVLLKRTDWGHRSITFCAQKAAMMALVTEEPSGEDCHDSAGN